MTDKKTEALQMALDWYDSGNENPNDFANMIKQVIALAKQQAQGCDYCNHPQYAGTKCKNCGREQPAQQQEIDELTTQRDLLADILTRTANALKGQPAELSLHSWHDLPEVAKQLKAAQPSKPLPEDYTALEQALTRLQKRYADLEGKASKPWVGLTDEEIVKITADPCLYIRGGDYRIDIARAIEAAHGIKEKRND